MALAPNRLNSMPNTGLASLGNALLGGATDYANISLRRQAEDRQRANQLADLQDQRQYQRGESERTRTLQQQGEIFHLLLSEGWLKPDDANNPQAIAKAAQDRQDHIDRQMAEKQIQDLNAGERADQVAAARDEAQNKISELNAVLAEPDPEPDKVAVANEALRMASATMKDGGKPTNEAIAEQFPNAYAALKQRQNVEWYQRKQNAAIQRQLLQDQLRDLSAESNTISNKFGKVGRSSPAAALAAPTQGAAPQKRMSAQDVFNLIASKTPPVAVPSPPSDPSMAPAASIVGAAQRVPSALSSLGSGARDLFDNATMTLAGIPGGLYNGDWSVPLEAGTPTEMANNGLAKILAPEILPGDYMSAERAKALKLRRSLDQPLRPLLPLPVSAPSMQFSPGF